MRSSKWVSAMQALSMVDDSAAQTELLVDPNVDKRSSRRRHRRSNQPGVTSLSPAGR